MDLEIFQVTAPALTNHWDTFVEPGLHQLIRDYKPRWRAEDIYALVFAGRAELFIARRGPTLLGFFVAYPQARTYEDVSDYFVMAMWSRDLKERADDDIDDTHRQVGNFLRMRASMWKCTGDIVHHSPRRGWAKLGFAEYMTIWHLPIGSGNPGAV